MGLNAREVPLSVLCSPKVAMHNAAFLVQDQYVHALDVMGKKGILMVINASLTRRHWNNPACLF